MDALTILFVISAVQLLAAALVAWRLGGRTRDRQVLGTLGGLCSAGAVLSAAS